MASALFADNLVGVAEAAGMLRVSAATVRNWLKSGRISQSASDDRGRPQFSVKYLEGMRAQAQRSARSKGRPRRGDVACPGQGRNAQAVEAICSAAQGRGALYMRAALCEAALRLMCRSGIVFNTSPRSGETCLGAWARGGIERAEAFEELLLGLLSDYRVDRIRQAAQALPEFKLDSSGDVLGMLYSSFLQMEGDGKARTPYAPEDLCDRVACDLGNERDVFLDPCCGSGGFILALLRRGISPERVYGIDQRRPSPRGSRTRPITGAISASRTRSRPSACRRSAWRWAARPGRAGAAGRARRFATSTSRARSRRCQGTGSCATCSRSRSWT